LDPAERFWISADYVRQDAEYCRLEAGAPEFIHRNRFD
jgi:hypothetical protein